jgi:uncharacterized protein
MRIAVQAWAPDYGSELDMLRPGEPTREEVDTSCEQRGWEAVAPGDRAAVEASEFVFVDGVRRADARLFLSFDGEGPLAGLAASVGVGAVACDGALGSRPRPARVLETKVLRLLAAAGGREVELAAGAGLEYRALPVEGFTVDELDRKVHGQMRDAEAAIALRHARDDRVVFVDGPLAKMAPGPRRVVGVIKSHSAVYLEPPEDALVAELGCGERTPIFFFGAPHRPRYSWYLRLCPPDPTLHSWHGIIRCEVPAAHTVESAVRLADCSTAVLVGYASQAHWDKRAPQNLVPIAGLERHLRHLLGDRELAYRLLRGAARRAGEEGEHVA